MFSSRNKIIVSYIDRTSIFLTRYRILNNTMAKGKWYFEKSHTHILAVNSCYENKNLKKFSLKLDNCDLCMDVKHKINTKSMLLKGDCEEYCCDVSYELKDNKELTYVRLDKSNISHYFTDDENLKYTF